MGCDFKKLHFGSFQLLLKNQRSNTQTNRLINYNQPLTNNNSLITYNQYRITNNQ